MCDQLRSITWVSIVKFGSFESTGLHAIKAELLAAVDASNIDDGQVGIDSHGCLIQA